MEDFNNIPTSKKKGEWLNDSNLGRCRKFRCKRSCGSNYLACSDQPADYHRRCRLFHRATGREAPRSFPRGLIQRTLAAVLALAFMMIAGAGAASADTALPPPMMDGKIDMGRINTEFPDFTLTAFDINDFTNISFGATMKNQDATGWPRVGFVGAQLLNSDNSSDQACSLDALYDGTSDPSQIPQSLSFQHATSPCLRQWQAGSTSQVLSFFIMVYASPTSSAAYSRITFYPPTYTGTMPTTAGGLPPSAVSRDWSIPTPGSDYCVQSGSSQSCGTITGDNNNMTNLCVMSNDQQICGMPACKDTVGLTGASQYCNVSTINNGCDAMSFNPWNCAMYWIVPNWDVLSAHMKETLDKVWDHFPFSIIKTFKAFFTALGDTTQPQQGFLLQVKPLCWDGYTALQQTQNWQDTTTSLCGGYTQAGQLTFLGEGSLGDKVLTLLRPMATAALLTAIWIGLGIQTIRVYWVENSRINRVGGS